MPYLILSDRRGEFDRRDLREPLVVGRALECDICIRDILLSRRHCRIEPFHDRWLVIDLGSKNGTHIGPEAITRHALRDGEIIRIGRSQVCFKSGRFIPARSTAPRPDVRPADPLEAMAGTVFGSQVFDMDEDAKLSGFPVPKPRPAEPKSYCHDAVHSIVTQLSSTTWDTRLRQPTPKLRPLPQVVVLQSPARAPAYIALAWLVGLAAFAAILIRSIL